MKRKDSFLYAGITISAILHLAVFGAYMFANSEAMRKLYKKSIIIPVEIKKPEPMPEPPKPKPVEKKEKKIEKKEEKKVEEVKEVFGVKNDTLAPEGPGIGVRSGNTLNKEMEKEYTPPEQVKELPKEEPKKFVPVPVFKINKMPEILSKVKPEYPKELKDQEIEGEVIIKISVDKHGNIVDAKVVSSDNPLFDKPAIEAIKKWKFKPAYLSNGEAVDTQVDITVIFQIEY